MAAGLCALVALLAGRALAAPPVEWVAADGDRLVVGQGGGRRAFRFVGANLAVMHGERERARYLDTLDAAARDGLTVGRIWAFGEGPADAGEWLRRHEIMRAGPDGHVEDALVHLDRVIAAAAERGLRLVVVLGNNWADYGGAPMYLRWAGLPAEGAAHDRFFDDPRARASFAAHVERVVGRVNGVTGVAYAADPTILAWELINEPTVSSVEGADARLAWIVEMARVVRRLDRRHLVGVGMIAYGTRRERAEWERVHRLAEIDYCDAHLYPQASERLASWPRLADLAADHAQLARFVLGKPLVVGELGFRTSGGGSPTWLGQRRAAWMDRLVGRLLGDGAAGALAWIYQPWLGHPRDYGIYVDRRDTDDMRGALRALAARLSADVPFVGDARVGPARGDRPLFAPELVVERGGRPTSAWRVVDGVPTLEIDPLGFAAARFEHLGDWDRGVLRHVYGAGAGRFEYAFAGPPGSPPVAALEVEARLSSEWPGAAGPPGGGSDVRVLVDGREVGRLAVVSDDGVGRVERLRGGDRTLLAGLRGGRHRLALEVPEGPRSNGLCIYSTATGKFPPPTGETPPIRLRLLPPPAPPARQGREVL